MAFGASSHAGASGVDTTLKAVAAYVVTVCCSNRGQGHLHTSAGNLIHQPQAQAAVSRWAATQRGSLKPVPATVSGLSSPDVQEYMPCLPASLKPISSSLACELKRQQQLKKRLRRQLTSLQRQLHDVMNTTSSQAITDLPGEGGLALDSSSSSSTDSASSSLEDSFASSFTDESDDPLFSASTPPSVEQLQRQLVYVRSQLLQASSRSLSDVLTGE